MRRRRECALFSRISAEDAMATRAIEFSAEGCELYWLDSRGRDTAAVVAQDLANGTVRVLAEDPRADFTQLVLDPISERPIAAARSFERVAWQVVDPDIGTISPSSLDRRVINTTMRRWNGFRAARQARRLFSSTPAWEGLPFVPMEPVVPRPGRARTRLLSVASARCGARGAPASGLAGPWWSLGARRRGRGHAPEAGIPRSAWRPVARSRRACLNH
jgi:hypothetical protein